MRIKRCSSHVMLTHCHRLRPADEGVLAYRSDTSIRDLRNRNSYPEYRYCIFLFSNIIPDSKRQQTTTVDNKRLINGLVLTRFASLRQNNSLDENKEVQTSHYS